MKINGKKSSEVTMLDFEELAKKFKIDKYKQIINKVKESYKLFKSLSYEILGEKNKYTTLELLNTREFV